MVQTPAKPFTLEDFLELPESKPASEFIAGQIIQKPMPQGKHSTIQRDLLTAINTVLKPNKIAWVYSELHCTFGGRSAVPDISIFIWARILRDVHGKVMNTFAIAPNWTIEILSPDQSQTKVVRNILHCLDHGTEMGWLINPDEETMFVYFADRTIAIFDQPDQQLRVPTFAAAVNLTISQIFSWLEG